jgi:hypothetical protein
MSVNITSQTQVQVAGGPGISATYTLSLDAYDLIDVTVNDGEVDAAIEVQPGGAGQVQLLMVGSDHYDANLSYKVDAPANPSHVLDRPLLLSGLGGVGLLGGPPSQLLFTNATGQNVGIQILVGREAT